MENCDADIDCEVDRVIDQILREDRLESMGLDPCPDSCEASCEDIAEEPHKNCAIETSARFSIRILEALRAVQRQKAMDTWPSCTMEEVVQYIRRHYHYDGDLCSQVETALDQVTVQGFVLKMGVNKYHLMGPFACGVPKPPAIGSCNRNRPDHRTSRTSRCRRRRPSRPIANSTLTAPDCSAPFSIDRLSTISDIEGSQRAEFQNRSNRERSSVREDGHPFNEDQEISILEEIQAPIFNEPIQRPGDVHGCGRAPRDRSFDGNVQEINPPIANEPIRRPGGDGRGRIVRDHSFDENVEEIYPPAANESMLRLGGCDGRGAMVRTQSSDQIMEEIENPVPNEVIRRPDGYGGQSVVENHSSDENMYCVEPVVNKTRIRPRRRRRRDSSSSRSSSNTYRCPARRSRRNNFSCSSDADVSDDTDIDECKDTKPWVRRCQNQHNRVTTRRGRKCSSCVYD